MIDSYIFGESAIAGRRHSTDVVVLPDGDRNRWRITIAAPQLTC